MTLEEARRLPNLFIEDAIIDWPNFAGREKKNNPEGSRNFCVRIPDEEMAKALTEDGWNVRIYVPKDENRRPFNFIPVAVDWNKKVPHLYPKITMISGINGTETAIDEDSVKDLDEIEMEEIRVRIRPRAWVDERDGSVRIKAYLAELKFVEVPMDYRTRYRT